jgi:hypothetical protein
MLVNRIDPLLFGGCFESWIKVLWADRHDLIAIDGKTSRRTHDTRSGLKALHTLSAYASNARLVLGQFSVPEKTNEIAAIPELLDHLAETNQLKGALVTIDAMACQVADKIVEHEGHYLLALKGNQPPRSRTTSVLLSQKNWLAKPRSKRGMAVLRRGPTRLRPRSIRSCPKEAIRGNRTSSPSRLWSRSTRVSSTLIDPLPTRGSTSRRPLLISNGLPTGCAVTGASRACTGCSMWNSRMISRATAAAAEQSHGSSLPTGQADASVADAAAGEVQAAVRALSVIFFTRLTWVMSLNHLGRVG